MQSSELALAEELRSQMPALAKRGSLVFRMTQKSWEELCLDREMGGVVFKTMSNVGNFLGGS